MAVARIKLLRNKREAVVRQMRRDIALLLQSGQDATARVRVEHVIREQNVLAANEFIELFCELVVARLSIIAKQKECPADLKEGIASLIFAAPRCSEIPELGAFRKIFEKKYGKDFVSAATDLRPNSGVNRMLIDKLSVRTPTGQVKLKIMKEIAKEYQIEWDTSESEQEFLKAPEELIAGPHTFVSASSLPVNPAPVKCAETNKPSTRSANEGDISSTYFEDTASAAEAAAESAKQAIAAAQAAAYLANKDFNQVSQASGFDHKLNASRINHGFQMLSGNPVTNQQITDHQPKTTGRMYEAQSFCRSHYNENTRPIQMDGEHIHHSYNETGPLQIDGQNIFRRHSYNEPGQRQMRSQNASRRHSYNEQNVSRRHSYNDSGSHSDIKFDESDCDEEIEVEEPDAGVVYRPPERPPPPVPSSHVQVESFPRVHPKLPDYDSLAARFEALKYHRSQT